ncbi:MAG: long-chain fatty acid--CoA ligase [Bacteroidales bacterium]|nr:long-chain fatty acid--CoA ligase [Bacteroidales bacterium]
MEVKTLGGLIKRSAEQFSDKPALGYVGERPVTYGEVILKINSIIAFLEKQGITSDDKVAILSSNQPNWGITYFSLATMGVTIVPILPDFTEQEIANVLNHAEVKAIFVSEGLYRKILDFQSDQLKLIVSIENFAVVPEGTDEKELLRLESSLVDTDKPANQYEIEPDRVASIIYTSGTTGKSKGVMLTHKNLVFSARQSGIIHPMDTTDSMLSVLPLSHTYENTIGLILPLMYGTAIYYLRKPPVPSVLIPAMKQVRPTIMLTVPLIMEKVYKGKVLSEINGKAITRTLYKFTPTRKLLNKVAGKKLYETFGGRLKFFGIGGAKVDPQVERFLIEANFPYAIGYGLTETSPLLAGFDSYKGRYQSTGPTMEGVTLKINDPDPITGEGEIWAKGDNVMKGYYKEPEITSEVLTPDGWFRTGDLGCFDKHGYLYIKGRLKNMIVGASGENIYPEEIEAIINRFKYVLESVVVQKKGKLVAMVHFNMEELEAKYTNLKDQASQLFEKKIEELSVELQNYVNSQVNKFSRVQLVIVHPEPFEKTATKKIKRFLYY